MPSTFTVALTYKSLSSRQGLPKPTTAASTEAFLPLMTHIFRLSFWKTFERVWTIAFDPVEVEMAGFKGRMSAVHLLETPPHTLADINGPDFLLVATAVFDAEPEQIKQRFLETRAGYSRDQYTAAHEGLIRQTPAAFVLDRLDNDIKGHSSWTWPSDAITPDYTALLTAFYCYGWLLSLRIERDQIGLNLTTREIANTRTAQTILIHRIELIGIQRHFLTDDRSNNKALQDICTRLRDKYDLDKRFDRLSRIHASIEHHLDNTFKVVQSRATRATNFAIRLLTFSAIPIGILSVILAIDLASAALADPVGVMSDHRLQVALLLSFAMPATLILLANLIDKTFNNNHKKR